MIPGPICLSAESRPRTTPGRNGMAAVLSTDMVFCRACGKQIHNTAIACPGCGATAAPVSAPTSATDKRILPAALLCVFLGMLGVHRFYVGKIGTGILQLLTFGGLGIWALVDMIFIVTSNFRDGDGEKITQWT